RQEALAVQHLEQPAGGEVEQERLVDLQGVLARGGVGQRRGHRDGDGLEVGPGDGDDALGVGQRRGAERQGEDGVLDGLHGVNSMVTPLRTSSSSRCAGGGGKGAARFTAASTALSNSAFPEGIWIFAESTAPVAVSRSQTSALSVRRSDSGMAEETL